MKKAIVQYIITARKMEDHFAVQCIADAFYQEHNALFGEQDKEYDVRYRGMSTIIETTDMKNIAVIRDRFKEVTNCSKVWAAKEYTHPSIEAKAVECAPTPDGTARFTLTINPAEAEGYGVIDFDGCEETVCGIQLLLENLIKVNPINGSELTGAEISFSDCVNVDGLEDGSLSRMLLNAFHVALLESKPQILVPWVTVEYDGKPTEMSLSEALEYNLIGECIGFRPK